MASVYKRKSKDGKSSKWRVVVRIKGYPVVCETFDRKQEAEDWGKDTERRIKSGQYKFNQDTHQNTFKQLVERFIQDGMLEHHRSSEDTQRHLKYWVERFGVYALIHITSEFIGKERQHLLNTRTLKGSKRSSATVNRYLSSLSAVLTYAAKELSWIIENPCSNLKKLKENAGRDRVLTEQEILKLLEACKESRSLYLFCIVLIALTTGSRQGEILNLEWSHIDFTNKVAYLKETKNGRPRSIALSDSVITELKKLYEKRNPLKLLVFASKTAFGRIDIKKAWKKALEKAGIHNCRAHDMRHTFATMAAKEGASNLQLATAMGHHRTLSMLQRYTHLDVEVTKKFSNRISEELMKGESL